MPLLSVVGSSIKRYSLTRGAEFALERRQLATDLTAEMLQSQSWKTAQFKAYNYKAKGRPIPHGALHPLMKVRAQFRSILLEMGSVTMWARVVPLVTESAGTGSKKCRPISSWKVPSGTLMRCFSHNSTLHVMLMTPSSLHVRRDNRCVATLPPSLLRVDPARTKSLPADYVERVRRTHENGGTTGSIGWRYPWSIDEAHKNLLRTHTTAISSKMLYQLAQVGDRLPTQHR